MERRDYVDVEPQCWVSISFSTLGMAITLSEILYHL